MNRNPSGLVSAIVAEILSICSQRLAILRDNNLGQIFERLVWILMAQYPVNPHRGALNSQEQIGTFVCWQNTNTLSINVFEQSGIDFNFLVFIGTIQNNNQGFPFFTFLPNRFDNPHSPFLRHIKG